MDDDSRLSILIVVVLLALAAFFAATETALSSVSRNKIKVARERGEARAEKALFALDNFGQAITTLLICTNIVHISAASIVTVFVTRIWGLSAVSLSTILTTILMFFVGEMLPKSIAKKNSSKYLLATAGILEFLMKLFYPLSTLLSKIGDYVSKVTKAEPEVSVTEEELYGIIEDLEEEGMIDEEQSDLLSSAIQFSDTATGRIMTKRDDIVAIDINENPENVLALAKETNHSRIPVFRTDIDHIIGVLNIRRYLKAYLAREEEDIPELKSLINKVFFTDKEIPIDELLEKMSEKKMNLAVIRDEKEKTLGIVTIEDILEELVGEIYDEFDEEVKA